MFWIREGVDIDLAGLNAETNTWPLTESLVGTLRRVVARVWFEVRNPELANENFLEMDGVLWSLIIWPFLEPAPLPGSIIEPGPSVEGNRMIAFGAGPGRRIEDTSLGVHRFRFPGDGAGFAVDVQSQRRPLPEPGNPWTPFVSWTFDRGNGVFNDVTHARVRVESIWLQDNG